MMYQTKSYKFSVKNTSMIEYPYTCKITDANTGIMNFGPYNIIPRNGNIAPGCEESFIMRFSPNEAEDSFPPFISNQYPKVGY